jgi:hypothetical protein
MLTGVRRFLLRDAQLLLNITDWKALCEATRVVRGHEQEPGSRNHRCNREISVENAVVLLGLR